MLELLQERLFQRTDLVLLLEESRHLQEYCVHDCTHHRKQSQKSTKRPRHGKLNHKNLNSNYM